MDTTTPRPEGSNAGRWDQLEEEKELLANDDSEAWEAFLSRTKLRCHRIAKKCGLQDADDATHNALEPLIRGLREGKIKTSVAYYFYAIVYSEALKIRKGQSKTKEYESTDPGLAPIDRYRQHDSRHPSHTLRTEDDRRLSEGKIRATLQSLREDLISELREKRKSRRQAPGLHLLVLEHLASGDISHEELRTSLGISDPSEITRLRDAAMDRMERHARGTGLTAWDPKLKDPYLEKIFREVWLMRRPGCKDEKTWAGFHDSHLEDMELQQKFHLEVLKCDLCAPATAEEKSEIDRRGTVELMDHVQESFDALASEMSAGNPDSGESETSRPNPDEPGSEGNEDNDSREF